LRQSPGPETTRAFPFVLFTHIQTELDDEARNGKGAARWATLTPLGEVSEWSKERDWKSRTC
jgi:hypothetical protein